MEKHPVALIPIATYDQAAVDTAVLQGVDLLGGIARFVQPEERVLLKLESALPRPAAEGDYDAPGCLLRRLPPAARKRLYAFVLRRQPRQPDHLARQGGAGIRHCGGRCALRRGNGGFLLRQCLFPSPTDTRQSRFTSAGACRMPTR